MTTYFIIAACLWPVSTVVMAWVFNGGDFDCIEFGDVVGGGAISILICAVWPLAVVGLAGMGVVYGIVRIIQWARDRPFINEP